MRDYLKDEIIDNPQNIKKLNGEIPTTKESPKNIIGMVAVIVFTMFTVKPVWVFMVDLFGSTSIGSIATGIVFGLLLLKTLSLTFFEESKNKKAHKEYLDNKLIDASYMWEVSNVGVREIDGDKVAYVDYIEGTRSVVLKLVPGATLNHQTPNLAEAHYRTLTEILNTIDSYGFTKDIYIEDEPDTSREAIEEHYNNLHNFDNEEYLEFFNDILETIEAQNQKSSIHCVYIVVNSKPTNKHLLVNSMLSLTSNIGKAHAFKDIFLLNEVHEIDSFFSHNLGVKIIDRDALIMEKFKYVKLNTGYTAVLAGYDEEGNLITQYNKEVDLKKRIQKKSKSISNKVTPKEKQPILNTITPEDTKEIEKDNIKEDAYGVTNVLTGSKKTKVVELLYSEDVVKLG